MEPVRDLIDRYWRRIYNFAFRMMLDRERAWEVTEETFLRAYLGDRIPPEPQTERWLLKISHHVVETKAPSTPEVSWDMLDETLRSEATRTDVHHSLNDPQRNFLLWELKQGCMTSVVNCLPLGERVAFVMAVILGVPEDDAASTLGITPSAFRVRLSRARKKIADYLAPRCEHVDPRNPCHCPSRLSIAIDRGFVKPPNAVVSIRRPSFGRYGSQRDGEDAPLRDVLAIYRSLPEPDPPEDLPRHLLAQLESGKWAELKAQKAHGTR